MYSLHHWKKCNVHSCAIAPILDPNKMYILYTVKTILKINYFSLILKVIILFKGILLEDDLSIIITKYLPRLLHDNATTTITIMSWISRTIEKKEVRLYNLHEGDGQKL